MFGYRLENDFDLALEQRRSRFGWVFLGALCLLLVCYFAFHLSILFLQIYFFTALFYGDSLYIKGKDKLREPPFWKAVVASMPLHAIFLLGTVALDVLFPVFRKALAWMPVLTLAFAVDEVLFDRIVERFSPSVRPELSPSGIPSATK